MNIKNIHIREYRQPKEVLAAILGSLASSNDRLWPWEIWPPMRLSDGLQVGSHGGHGPIGYVVKEYTHGQSLLFSFTKPEAFCGSHRFEIEPLAEDRTILRHTIEMTVTWRGWVLWGIAIRWLHDALLEDALDKVHNQLSPETMISSSHGLWVRVLRWVLRRGKN